MFTNQSPPNFSRNNSSELLANLRRQAFQFRLTGQPIPQELMRRISELLLLNGASEEGISPEEEAEFLASQGL